ncbi:T9SS type A sorting domain-containing protein [Aquimarina litoralis]
MKKVKLLIPISLVLVSVALLFNNENKNEIDNQTSKVFVPFKKEGPKKMKTLEERRRFAEERRKHEFDLQANPKTGKIPVEEKQSEIFVSNQLMVQSKNAKSASNTSYISRGPSNLGGRTRTIVFDRSDNTGNTIIAGGVSSGVFRTTDGGANWSKVSSNNEIHNVTTIVQDPRNGFENIWYYGTGESFGNSANADGAAFLGQGIWQSTDSGQSWTQLPSTASVQEQNDSPFDFMFKIAVHPTTGDLYAGAGGAIRRFDGTDWTVELDSGGNFFSDVVITSTGIVYASFSGNSTTANGVWQSPTGIGSYTRIGSNVTPGFGSNGRAVLAVAPSNEDIVYLLHTSSGLFEAGLWQWNDSTDTWTNRTNTMPDEPGGDLAGNDPIAVQGGYDLVVGVKPDDENFVLIGGTNAYKIEDITTDASFTRIGGYRNNQSYALYDLGIDADEHHPDIHAFAFPPNNPDVLFTGTDGGIHRTDNINAATVSWTNLNNDYQTYQYYHVATDPRATSDIVIGGAQDNGTTGGGISFGLPDATTMFDIAGGDGVAVGVAPSLYYLGVQRGPVFRVSTSEFSEITPEGIIVTGQNPRSQFVTYFYLDESNNNALYYAGLNTLFSTSDASNVTATTWNDLGSLPFGENIKQMKATWGAYDASSSYLLVGGNQGSLFRLNDPQNATAFTDAVEITPPGRLEGTVSGIAIHPTNNDIVMVTYSNYGITNIYITTNATSDTPTWTVAERNLDTFSIRSAAITEIGSETRYFVGTARGLYSSLDPVNEDWEIEAPNQIGFAVVSALAYKPSNNTLLIGTHGNGMYEGTIEATLSVEEFDTTDSKFVFWPNPAKDVINVEVESTFVKGDLDFSVFSFDGKEIKTGVLNSNKQINVDNIPQGNYILQIRSDQTEKAVIFNKN